MSNFIGGHSSGLSLIVRTLSSLRVSLGSIVGGVLLSGSIVTSLRCCGDAFKVLSLSYAIVTFLEGLTGSIESLSCIANAS